ncbi:uncharacterized protein VTP21DRAFT_7762 [Calcarisporiella thermophila]|uniref:uncharacterized protein n=1 Tax=Calcarisporiella thermophila TaxID=911321 RepID=UPI003743EFF1
MKFLSLVSVFLTFTLTLGAPHKRQVESAEYILQLINTIRQAHGVKTLPWNVDLEKASLTRAQMCVDGAPTPPNTSSLAYTGASSWKDAIMKVYTYGLSQYDYNNPDPQSSDLGFILFVVPKYKSVGCAATSCSGDNVHQCLFDFEGVPYQTIDEFINDIKTNVHPPNSTITLDPTVPTSMKTNFAPPLSYSARFSS